VQLYTSYQIICRASVLRNDPIIHAYDVDVDMYELHWYYQNKRMKALSPLIHLLLSIRDADSINLLTRGASLGG